MKLIFYIIKNSNGIILYTEKFTSINSFIEHKLQREKNMSLSKVESEGIFLPGGALFLPILLLLSCYGNRIGALSCGHSFLRTSQYKWHWVKGLDIKRYPERTSLVAFQITIQHNNNNIKREKLLGSFVEESALAIRQGNAVNLPQGKLVRYISFFPWTCIIKKQKVCFLAGCFHAHTESQTDLQFRRPLQQLRHLTYVCGLNDKRSWITQFLNFFLSSPNEEIIITQDFLNMFK